MAKIVVGTVLNKTYRIERQLAEGGMGVVYLATHARLPSKRFALKVLNTEHVSDDLYARFRREAEIAARLEHPHIVDVVDYNKMPDGKPYLVMEYLEGATLASHLAEGEQFAAGPLLAIVEQVASGLHAAHAIGVVHRDVKPANIFLVDTPDEPVLCKILDFGVSKLRDTNESLTRAHMLLGTFEFMSPEQALGGSDEVDATSDIFALGTLAYTLLTGRQPFVGSNPPRLLASIRHYQPDFRLLPLALRPVIARALAKQKEERYQQATTFSEKLREAMTNQKCSTGPSPSITPASEQPWFRRTFQGVPPAPLDGGALLPEEGDSVSTVADAPVVVPPRADVDGPEVDGPEVDGPEVDGPEGVAKAQPTELEGPTRIEVYNRRPLFIFGALMLLVVGASLVLFLRKTDDQPPAAASVAPVAPASAPVAAPVQDRGVDLGVDNPDLGSAQAQRMEAAERAEQKERARAVERAAKRALAAKRAARRARQKRQRTRSSKRPSALIDPFAP